MIIISFIYVIKFLIILFAICVVQYFLSKKKYLGLVIPIIFFLFSIIVCVIFGGIAKDKYMITTDKGHIYTYQTEQEFETKIAILIKDERGFTTKVIQYPEEKLSNIIICFCFINGINLILISIYVVTNKLKNNDQKQEKHKPTV